MFVCNIYRRSCWYLYVNHIQIYRFIDLLFLVGSCPRVIDNFQQFSHPNVGVAFILWRVLYFTLQIVTLFWRQSLLGGCDNLIQIWSFSSNHCHNVIVYQISETNGNKIFIQFCITNAKLIFDMKENRKLFYRVSAKIS